MWIYSSDDSGSSSFDLFVDPDKIIATRLEEQGRSGTVSSYATGQGQALSKKQKPQMPQTRQMPIGGSVTSRKPIRPAFQQSKAAMIDDDDDEGSIPSFVSRESSSIKKEPPPYHPVGMYASHSKNRERLDLK